MNKSKFKSVKFLPLNVPMTFDYGTLWQYGSIDFVFSFQERFIQQHPELFEVEKAEREFEVGYYKAWITPLAKTEVIQFNGSYFTRNAIIAKYKASDFFEIGKRIEL